LEKKSLAASQLKKLAATEILIKSKYFNMSTTIISHGNMHQDPKKFKDTLEKVFTTKVEQKFHSMFPEWTFTIKLDFDPDNNMLKILMLDLDVPLPFPDNEYGSEEHRNIERTFKQLEKMRIVKQKRNLWEYLELLMNKIEKYFNLKLDLINIYNNDVYVIYRGWHFKPKISGPWWDKKNE
jgi:hypothetical protein